ncbi:MAG: ABC transporter ATP-binding protein [Thermincola sp.]|jgi:putative ABC transport system ATP-binding protein|nr:ABC transporter ATP-binding protein [Thermincola sp.]MDT3702724.1 ABC transporter ATP-binding protein [Thermincola sp.]
MVIKFCNMDKLYGRGNTTVHALKNLNLHIASGEIVAIMGPSGSGKSTLMNIIGFLDRPSRGIYEFQNKNINNLTDNNLAQLRNQYIGFVFQNFNLLSRATALANVELPMLYAGVPGRKRRKIALELLEVVGLKERVNHMPNELSGGQKQRVAIARALVNHPAVLLADEPTGNLDTHSGKEIMKLFETLNCIGVTVVIVTHDDDVARYARRILYIRDGLLVSDEKTNPEICPMANRH